MREETYYAIGDVHGEAALLDALIERILVDAGSRPAHIVLLGDLIDRGPDSRAVVERAMSLQCAPPEGVRLTVLKGNHEVMMLVALDTPSQEKRSMWLRNGGRETLVSYGIAPDATPESWREHIPQAHVSWLAGLPLEHAVPDRRLVFVHAGIDPSTYPETDDHDRLWSRSRDFLDCARWPDRPELAGLVVVHGHTTLSVPVPDVQGQRINLDTGACHGGPLSAVALERGRAPRILQAYRRASTQLRRSRS